VAERGLAIATAASVTRCRVLSRNAVFRPLGLITLGPWSQNKLQCCLGLGRKTNYNVAVRGILTMLATVAALAALAMCFALWAASPHSPDLRPNAAAALISARPEFNRYASVVAVSATTRGKESLNTCCYTADFSFRQNGATSVIPARADFRFYNKQWHLDHFSWGNPPNVTIVPVDQ
jgi:hypothetical protein